MKKLKFLALLLGLLLAPIAGATVANAQSSSLTATITDSDSQTWNNGKWTATLINPVPQVPPAINGTPLTSSQQHLSGTMSNSGVITGTFSDNGFITPAGTSWQFTICPNASVTCSVGATVVTGASPNLSTTLSSFVSAPRFTAASTSYGYLDVEVNPIPNPGGTYFNVSTPVWRQWNGSSWVSVGSGGSSLSLTTTGSSGPSTLISSVLNVPVYSSGQSISNSATINTANTQVQADSIVNRMDDGLTCFGDSITAGIGDAYDTQGYCFYMGVDYGVTPNNQGVPGDGVADETWHMFTTLNPQDTGNGVVTSMIGTNNTSPGITPAQYEPTHLAGHAWAAMSVNNKVLAGAPAVTLTGTTTADTTFTNANGITCSSGPCTATLTISAGSSQFFYLWYKEISSGANFSVTVDGSTATDTITGLTTINTTFGYAPTHQSSTVGLARYAASNTGTAASHTVVVTFQTGATIIGFGFPPTIRYRGVGAPGVRIGGVPPEENLANDTATANINSFNLADSKTLVADGLYAPFVDVYHGLDPVLDFQGAGASTVATMSGNTLDVTIFNGGPPITVGQIFVFQFQPSIVGYITGLGSGTGGVGTYTTNVSASIGSGSDVYFGIQNCVTSTSGPLHPNHCGHIHLSQLFESVINAVPIPPINTNPPTGNIFNFITGGHTSGGFTQTITSSLTIASLLRVNIALNCDTAVSAATITATLNWTDFSNTAQSVPVTVTCTTLGTASQGSLVYDINARSATAVTVAITQTGSPSIDVGITAESLIQF